MGVRKKDLPKSASFAVPLRDRRDKRDKRDKRDRRDRRDRRDKRDRRDRRDRRDKCEKRAAFGQLFLQAGSDDGV
jgi:hypothetical protein